MTDMCVAVANYIVELTNQYNNGKAYSERISMTCKRLQKLLYFSDVKFMQNNNGASMFKDSFYAWPSGPVIPSVYDEFVQYQNGEMMPVGGDHSPITMEMQLAIDDIFQNTIEIDTFDLVEMSHIAGGPWDSVYNPNDENHCQIISKEDMFKFYQARQILAKV